jgi:hypothetical protein
MAASGTINIQASIGGGLINATITRTAESVLRAEVELPAGSAGTLSTRTDDDTGIVTVEAGHGILDTDYVDLYWSGGVRYGLDVTAQDATTISIDIGEGDNLPTETSAIVITKRVEIDEQFDGDVLNMLAVNCNQRGHVEFEESGGTTVKAQELKANEPWTWVTNQSFTNPLTGNAIGKIQASNGSGTTAATLKILGLKDTVS